MKRKKGRHRKQKIKTITKYSLLCQFEAEIPTLNQGEIVHFLAEFQKLWQIIQKNNKDEKKVFKIGKNQVWKSVKKPKPDLCLVILNYYDKMKPFYTEFLRETMRKNIPMVILPAEDAELDLINIVNKDLKSLKFMGIYKAEYILDEEIISRIKMI